LRIVLICHYFHPEIGAPSARLHSLARNLRALGHDVAVLTGFPNHPTGVIPIKYRGRWVMQEDMDGVRVLRNWVYATPNEGIVKKTLGHLSFMFSSVLLGAPRLGKADVVVVSSPTFFAVLSAWVISLAKGVPFVFEVRDLWPAVFVELGVLKNRWIIKALEAVEMFLYRRAAAVVTVTESFRENLVSRGIPRGKVSVITNGVDLEEFSPGDPDPELRRGLSLEGKFIVLYIGAHGISHALAAVLEAARRLRERRDILFLFVGEGAEKKGLMKRASDWGLENVRFLSGQPRERVQEFYRLADICLVPLRNIPLFDTFIPSKMFEIMACGKPIVASVRGEPRMILERSGAAAVVDPEGSGAIAEAVVSLQEDPSRRRDMGIRGRAFVEKYYQRRALAERYAAILAMVAAPAP